jgi:hypothetical protein
VKSSQLISFNSSLENQISESMSLLDSVHRFLVQRCTNFLKEHTHTEQPKKWGIQFKRDGLVSLSEPEPKIRALIGKEKERFGEVLNMIANIERMLDGLRWFGENPEFSNLSVVCHPATSSRGQEGRQCNVELKSGTQIIVKCEITDIVSRNIAHNGKEKLMLKALGWEGGKPLHAARCFICTSSEFGSELRNASKSNKRPFTYEHRNPGGSQETMILELKAKQ